MALQNPPTPLPTVAWPLMPGWWEILPLGSEQQGQVSRPRAVSPWSRETQRPAPLLLVAARDPWRKAGAQCGQCQAGAADSQALGQHHPGCPASSQALGVEWREGRSASRAQDPAASFSAVALGPTPSPQQPWSSPGRGQLFLKLPLGLGGSSLLEVGCKGGPEPLPPTLLHLCSLGSVHSSYASPFWQFCFS